MAPDPSFQRDPAAVSTWRSIGPWLVLVAAIILAYLPALQGELLLGDLAQLTARELRTLAGLQRIWFEPGATPQYAPLLHSVFWLEHRLWGDAVAGYHLANVLQHALAAWLVFALVRRLERPGALFAAFLFALHPVAVESVAWISGQKNTLAAVFYLAAAVFYLGYDRERIMWQYDVALALFVLALLTHPVTATLPAALLVVFWWERGRLEWKRDLVPLLPWFALAAGTGAFAIWYEQRFGGAASAIEPTWMERVLIASRALWFYLRTLVWPGELMLVHPRWTIDASAARPYALLAAVIVLAAALAWQARRQRGPLAAFLVFALALLPVLGLVNLSWFRFSYVAERFAYLAILTVVVPVTIALTRYFRRSGPRHGSVARVGTFAVVLVLGALTFRHATHFASAEALYRHAVSHNPAAWLAHARLGAALEQKPGALPEAVAHYRRALALEPDHAPTHHHLGRALARLPGGLPEALRAFERSLQLQPEAAAARVDYAHALAQIPERLRDAVAEYEKALALAPERAATHYHLGQAFARLGQTTDAIAAYERAVRLRPEFADAFLRLGDALAQEPTRVRDAIAAYEGALHLAPDDVHARLRFARLLATVPERNADAVAQYERVVRSHVAAGEALAEAHFELGKILLADDARRQDALAHFEAALRVRPDWPEANALVRQVRGD